ncbi:MAG: OmpH family outer membrane protein [Holosporales bacterium]|jgi:Skp family chaperone for outer membrane proteins|nr:OmpH family outer membrane protein [Holosporales bacterium]
MTKRFIAAIWAFVIIVGIATAFVVCTHDRELGNDKRGAVSVAVVDGGKLKATAKCFSAHEKIASMFSDVFAKIRDSENAMKKEYEAVKNNSKLSQKQRDKEISKIEAKWSAESAKYNAAIQDVRNLEAKLADRIQKEVLSTVQSIAKSMNVDIVVNKLSRDMLSIFYHTHEVDITDIVIKKLDEILPEINLEEVRKW